MDVMQRRRVMLAAGKKPRLPREYQEVECLESTGTQYIDTGVVATGSIGFIADLMYINTTRRGYIGALQRSPTIIRYHFGLRNDNDFTLFFGYGDYFDAPIPIVGTDRNKVSFDPSSNTYTANGNTVTLMSKDFNTRLNYYLFTRNDPAGSMFQIMKIYSFALTSGPILLRSFIPCYRKSDNEPGMYDLAGSICPLTNSPFYINSGSGEFLVGPDVN